MKNNVVSRAVLCLAHPISIAAIALLLLNDHFFKIQSASWLTGKLSDFSGLVFFPFLLAVPLALLIPGRHTDHINRVGRIACIVTGIAFGLIKTIPVVNAAAVQLLALVGLPR